MISNRMNRLPAKGAGLLSGVKRRLNHSLVLAGSALLLSACTGESSDEIAQEQPNDLALAQCEVAEAGILGEPIEPITVNGVETQACLLSTDAGQVERVVLKSTHNYEPLAWVLDGVYEFGQSKDYGTLAELQADNLYVFRSNQSLYAREGTLVVVHRNAYINADIVSVDDDNIGGGEWGGVVVNGIGYHPDCPAGTSADNFCNIEGDWGYFGGLSQAESRESTNVLEYRTPLTSRLQRTGFTGFVAEAGGELTSGPQLSAAITINALDKGQVSVPAGVYYSAKNGLELNGGTASTTNISNRIDIHAMGNQGHAIYWHSGFTGPVGGVGGPTNGRAIYHDAEVAALKGENGGSGENGVSITHLTLIDRSLNAGTAIEFTGGGDIEIDNVVVQGFGACLGIGDAMTNVSIANSVFYCDETTMEADDGVDHAAQVIDQAENLYTFNPDLTPRLEMDNSGIEGVAATDLGSNTQIDGYELGLYYDPCYGAGTLLEETIDIGQDTYDICQLEGEVTDNFYFDDDINGELVAWRIDGAVTLGGDFAAMDAAQQQALLAKPQKVILDDTSRIQLPANASLTVNPGAVLTIAGTAQDPVELQPQDAEAGWGGITINGLVDSCANAEICELARQQFVEIDYLRLLNAGNDQPALTLNEVSAAGQITNLDIADSASDGLALNGGAVNIDNLLVAGAAGNQVQWSNGYRGTLQYAILQPGENSLGHALHGRNNSDDHNAAPRSRPVMASVTMQGSESADTAILLEQGSGLLLYNSVVADFNTCLDIDDQATDDLQYMDPAEIYFDNVILDCEDIVAVEDEDGGFDFAANIQGLSGVYEVEAVLDSNFVPTGPDIPGIESTIDLTLAGASAIYLNPNVGYMGSVRDSQDHWYLGWSDSVGILLAEECDLKGVLENDFTSIGNKVCGLRGTITEDLILTAYTGTDETAVKNGTKVVDPDTGEERDPIRTTWLINGLVRIGEGHLEITDPAQAEAMKADPVTLGIEASARVRVTNDGGLHITRGGELVVRGGEDLVGEAEPDDSSPVRMTGVGNWIGLIVDGFARNNQCPEAATAEPGSRVCNIQGEFGYYGGYDDNHGNLDVENLHMEKGSLRLNSVGRGGKVENFYFGLGSNISLWGADNLGRAAIDIDGGTANLRTVYIDAIMGGSAIRWNHGYRGNMQSVFVRSTGQAGANASNAPAFFDPLFEDGDGNWQTYPLVRGANGEAGHEDDLPRSMPTLANITLRAWEPLDLCALLPICEPVEVRSTAIELFRGSGVYLYNSVVGNTKVDFEGQGIANLAADQCISADASVAALLAQEVVLNQVTFACKEMSLDTNLAAQINETFESRTYVNMEGTFSNKSMLHDPSLADADIYYFDWVVGGGSPATFTHVPGVNVFAGWDAYYKYPTPDVINLGNAPMDYSASQSVDPEFIVDTNHFGALDYFLPIEAEETIQAD